jgi:hypothetical protein
MHEPVPKIPLSATDLTQVSTLNKEIWDDFMAYHHKYLGRFLYVNVFFFTYFFVKKITLDMQYFHSLL